MSDQLETLLDEYQSAIHRSIAADSNFSGCSPAEVEDRLNKVLAARAAVQHQLRAECNHAELVAQFTAHRACTGAEHDVTAGKIHGCCVVCGVDWPCDYADGRRQTDSIAGYGFLK